MKKIATSVFAGSFSLLLFADTLTNGSFESVDDNDKDKDYFYVTTEIEGGYQSREYNGWIFAGASGLSKSSDTAWHSTQTFPDNGSYVAFLQDKYGGSLGTLTQTVVISEPGIYTLSFYAAARPDHTNGKLRVSFAGTRIADDIALTGTTLAKQSFTVIVNSAGSYDLAFQIIDTNYGDNAIILDAVTFEQTMGDADIDACATGLTAFNALEGTVAMSATPLSHLLSSAAVWYDPSDENTLTKGEEKDGKTPVTAIANKGSAGSSMDAALYSDDSYTATPATLATMNNLTAIGFAGNRGFITSDHTFTAGSGRAVFAVARRNADKDVYPIQWNRAGWAWDVDGILGFAQWSNGKSVFYIGHREKAACTTGKSPAPAWPTRRMYTAQTQVTATPVASSAAKMRMVRGLRIRHLPQLSA